MALPTKESSSTARMVCRWCSKEFLEYKHRIKSGHGIFCSRSCSSKNTFTGRTSWCSGTKGLCKPNKGSFQKGQSAPMRGVPNLKIRAENHWNWRGGRGTERHLLHNQMEYKIWRDKVFARDNYTCQICDEYGGYLHADHIKSWAKHPEMRFEVDNGRALCRVCHYYITFKHKMPTTSRWGITRKVG